jgi:glycosyltransferase involved in cell wall biosynthesis
MNDIRARADVLPGTIHHHQATAETKWAGLRRLGYRKPRLLRGRDEDTVADMVAGEDLGQGLPFAERQGLAVVSICTLNHSHYARTMFESIRSFHPDLPFILVVADADRLGFPDIPGVRMVSPRQLGAVDFPYAALKYSAADLCCALKPLALRWLIATSRFRSLVYVDSDMCVYESFDRFLDAATRHRAVVVPHVREPLPNPERFWERPSLGDLAYSGVLNAGLFSLWTDPEARGFVETWSRLTTAAGAFLPVLGGQWEQNSFNWITAFLDGVHVFRDPTYNVAYWNLHDRSLRDKRLDHELPRWTVDGEPLVCFHFSGFSPDEPLVLSRHDRRYSLFHLPSLGRLADDYANRLRRNGADACRQIEYGYDRFPDGTPIDARIRRIFQEDEVFLRREADPWTAEGQQWYCEALLSPVPHRASLMPVLFESIFRERPDLQASYPDADLNPETTLKWFITHGLREYNCRALYDRYRQVMVSPGVVEAQARRLDPRSASRWAAPLTSDRSRVIEALQGSISSAELDGLVNYAGEAMFVSRIRSLRAVFNKRPDLQDRYPDVFFQDAAGFTHWLSHFAESEELLTGEFAAAFHRCAGGRSLARIFSYLNRSPDLVAAWPLALVGRGSADLARELLRVLRHGLEFDVDDIVMYLWMMEAAPWSGCELTLELLPHLSARPSSRLPEGCERLLAPVAQDARMLTILNSLRERGRSPEAAAEFARIRSCEQMNSQFARATDYLRARRLVDASAPALASVGPAPGDGTQPGLPGINIFGFFKSPIGLGEMTRGVSEACDRIGVPTARNVLGNVTMDEDLAPADFLGRFRHDFSRNLFVSYPHLDAVILHQYPVWMTAGRENIVYLAWEQRDGSHYWREVFAGVDQVWALSSFAARSLETCLGRTVHAVPCVMDLNALPSPSTKEAFGLNPHAAVVLYVFDATSSIERKNPEAALAAFAAAFGPNENVQLCIKVSNAGRLEHRHRLQAFLRQASRLGSRVRILTDQFTRPDTLRLISAVDCYMSLHRSEGFGYTCAEAMAYGVPVIATRYSGNLDFMDDDSAYLVEAREVEVRHAEGPFPRGSVWAEPSLEGAVEALRAVLHRPDEARARGARGRALVAARLSPAAIARRIAPLLGISEGAAVIQEAEDPGRMARC